MDLPHLALTWLRRCMTIFAATLFTIMILAVFAQVLSRYLFNFSIAWATELATYSQIWMVLIGAGIAMQHGAHIGIDTAVRRLPISVRSLSTLTIGALGLWFFWVFFSGSLDLLRVGAVQRMPALQLPMSWAYASLPVGAAYFAFEFLLFTIRSLTSAPEPGSTES